jgi:hypothetical protein
MTTIPDVAPILQTALLNARLFRYWNDLPTALRPGQPRNEVKHGGKTGAASAAVAYK